MGFQPASPDDITYVARPGVRGQSAVDLSTPGLNRQPAVPVILPEYTESWFDYFMNQQALFGTRPEVSHETTSSRLALPECRISLLAVLGIAILVQIVRIQTSPEVARVIDQGAQVWKDFFPPRGEIYDRHGSLLAGNKTVYEIGLDLTAKSGYANRHAGPPDVRHRPQ